VENHQGSLAAVGVTYPAVLLTDIPVFCPSERSLSRGYVRRSCRPGDRYPANEGLMFIDQSGES
jgi:hypothetical protein